MIRKYTAQQFELAAKAVSMFMKRTMSRKYVLKSLDKMEQDCKELGIDIKNKTIGQISDEIKQKRVTK